MNLDNRIDSKQEKFNEKERKIRNLENMIKNSISTGYDKIGDLTRFISNIERDELKAELKKTVTLNPGNDFDSLTSYMIDLQNLKLSVIKEKENLRRELEEKIIEIIKEFSSEELSSFTKKLFPNLNINTINNPQNITDYSKLILISSIENIITVIKLVFEISKGIILSPIHLYEIISGKSEYKRFKEI